MAEVKKNPWMNRLLLPRSLFVALVATFLVFFPAAAHADVIEDGKEVFNGSAGCAMCHKTSAEFLVGPGLAGNASQHTDAWLVKWFKDPQGTWEENDAETQQMKIQLKKQKAPRTTMKKRKELSDEEIQALIAYLKTL